MLYGSIKTIAKPTTIAKAFTASTRYTMTTRASSTAKPLSQTVPIDVTYTPEPSILSARAHCSSQRGTLELAPTSLRFVAHGHRPRTIWSHPLSHILEISKLTIPLTSLPPQEMPGVTKITNNTSALTIFWIKPEMRQRLKTTEEQPDSADVCVQETCYAMEKEPRDWLCNAILGVSGITWMELQPRALEQTRSN